MIVINLLDVLEDEIKEEEVVEGMKGYNKHDHEAADENHNHEEGEIEYDEHVWLSIKDSMIICEKIKDELVKLDGDNLDIFERNLKVLNVKLEELDNEYKYAVDFAKNKTLVFGDRFPFRYLVDDYGLDYYAAFAGCSAETEASFFLFGYVNRS